MERTGSRGFTVIELMIVIAIIGIIASMALPSYNTMIENNRRVAAVNELVSTMHQARSEAITRNQRISICRSNAAHSACVTAGGDWKDGWLVFLDLDGNGALNESAGDEILAVGNGLRGSLYVVSTDYANSITFLPNGRVAGAGGSMLLCSPEQTTAVRRIDISRVGRPRAVTNPGDSCA